MKRRIFLSMCCIASLSVITITLLISLVHYNEKYQNLKDEIKKTAVYLDSAYNENIQKYTEFLRIVSEKSGYHISWLTDNQTLYDSKGENQSDLYASEYSTIEKHLESENIRVCNSDGKKYFYYAIESENKTILIVGAPTTSFVKELVSNLPYLIIIICVTLIVIGFVSNIQTEQILKPIKTIDLNDPQSAVKYEELGPLLKKIEKQNYDIHKYIKTLKDKQNEFETVTQNMNEGLIVLKDRNILTCNKSALRILGSEGIDYTGISVHDLTNSEVFLNSVETALKGKKNEVYLPVENKNYTQFTSPVFTKSKVTGAVILLIDSTEKYSREALRREFSANVSHELKTPLTTISGYAEIMKEGWVQPQDFAQFSEKIYNEAKRMISLIDDIINLSKLDENSTQMKMEPVDLYLISQDVMSTLSDKAKKKNIAMTIEGDEVEVNAVPHLLFEMIYNLVDNAIKYNKVDGKIDISVEKTQNFATLSVKDTGIGIPPEDTERVFERFYCVDKSHSKETGGTGLGLSIVKHGAILHNAVINVESSLGIGTKISLKFNAI